MKPIPCRSLADLLETRAALSGGEVAFTFLPDGERPGPVLSYGELRRRAMLIGEALRGRCGAGDRVLLLFPPGLDFVEAFFGCLYARTIAVPAPAPHPARLAQDQERLGAIARDAGVKAVLTVEALARASEVLGQRSNGLGGVAWIATDALQGEPEPGTDAELLARVGAGDVALLQYTSGSTSAPRGVMVTHQNLLHNLEAIQRTVGHGPHSAGVSWLPAFHDMGLIGGILQPVYGGYPMWLMPPTAFLQRPARWLEAISAVRATFSGGPNFAYDLCVRRTDPAQRGLLDLSSWSYAFNGSEPVRARVLDEFSEAFAPAGFKASSLRPVYGLAEATLMVSGGDRSWTPRVERMDLDALAEDRAVSAARKDSKAVVSCGPPVTGTRVEIVNPATGGRLGEGEIGEIWAQGPGVALGYWAQPDLSKAMFGARLTEATEEGAFLRTGDLGFLSGGELFITGRLKDLIVIRGRKHYPQDIETTAEQSHGALRTGGCAAFGIETSDGEALGMLVEVDTRWLRKQREEGADEDFDSRELKRIAGTVRQAVAAEHGLRIEMLALASPGAVLKTTSGKVRRGACRAACLRGEAERGGGDLGATLFLARRASDLARHL